MLRKHRKVIKQRNERYSLRTDPRKISDCYFQCFSVQKTHIWEHDQTLQTPQW